jgi:hypothetical protein
MQMQLELSEARFCDFVCLFRQRNTITVWRVFRNRNYWTWLRSRLDTFLRCVAQRQCPSDIDIPLIGHEAESIAKLGYDHAAYKAANRGSTLEYRQLPPRVHFEEVISFDANLDELIERREARRERERQLQLEREREERLILERERERRLMLERGRERRLILEREREEQLILEREREQRTKNAKELKRMALMLCAVYAVFFAVFAISYQLLRSSWN